MDDGADVVLADEGLDERLVADITDDEPRAGSDA